jgi:hypothetical protein
MPSTSSIGHPKRDLYVNATYVRENDDSVTGSLRVNISMEKLHRGPYKEGSTMVSTPYMEPLNKERKKLH